MSTLDRWRLAARAQLNALLERTAETGAARQALVDEARAGVREALAANKQHVAGLVAEVARLREDAARAENAAMAALKLHDETSARERLGEKLRLDREREEAERSVTAAREEVSALEADLAAFELRLGQSRGGRADAEGAAAAEDKLADLKRKLDK